MWADSVASVAAVLDERPVLRHSNCSQAGRRGRYIRAGRTRLHGLGDLAAYHLFVARSSTNQAPITAPPKATTVPLGRVTGGVWRRNPSFDTSLGATGSATGFGSFCPVLACLLS